MKLLLLFISCTRTLSPCLEYCLHTPTYPPAQEQIDNDCNDNNTHEYKQKHSLNGEEPNKQLAQEPIYIAK